MSIGEELGREEKLGSEFFRLIYISHEKRKALEGLTRRKLRLKSFLTFASGILSLLSAATLTAVVIHYASSSVLSIVAVVLAFIGGILALTSGYAYNHRELLNLYLGASKFLELRERVSVVACNRQLKYETRNQRLAGLWKEYAELSTIYDHYVKVGEPPTSPTFQIGHEIAARQIGEEKVKDYHRKLFTELEESIKRLDSEP